MCANVKGQVSVVECGGTRPNTTAAERFGTIIASARAAAPSWPMNPKNENTTVFPLVRRGWWCSWQDAALSLICGSFRFDKKSRTGIPPGTTRVRCASVYEKFRFSQCVRQFLAIEKHTITFSLRARRQKYQYYYNMYHGAGWRYD